MFITKKKHNQIVLALQERIKELNEKVILKDLLERIIEKNNIVFGSGLTFSSGTLKVHFPDNIAQYVDDYFGGKVLKQEATKVVVLDKEGNATYHYTKNQPDKKLKYKLVQL